MAAGQALGTEVLEEGEGVLPAGAERSPLEVPIPVARTLTERMIEGDHGPSARGGEVNGPG